VKFIRLTKQANSGVFGGTLIATKKLLTKDTFFQEKWKLQKHRIVKKTKTMLKFLMLKVVGSKAVNITGVII